MPEVIARGVRFHVETMGEGPPTAVFLHGLVMDNLSSWYFTVANPIAKAARSVLWDLRGHGRSDRPPSGYSIDDMVADCDAVLAELGIGEPVHVVGNSFGGLLAVAFAIAHPGRVKSLVLVDGNLHDERWAPDITRSFALEGAEREALIVKYAYSWAGRYSPRRSKKLVEAARQLVYETSLVGDLARSPPVTDAELRTITCPVLALHGHHSELLDRGQRLQRVLPACELRLFPDSTHLLLWERTDELKDVIAAWLQRHG